MLRLTTIAYAHRRNGDGTTDSICRNCFVTVITALWEGDLTRAEHDHICDPNVLDYWKKLREGGDRPHLQQYGNYESLPGFIAGRSQKLFLKSAHSGD